MKNANLPIIQALKGRSKKSESMAPSFELPRTFELNHHEIPGLPGKQIGEGISVRLDGHIHSQHDDGRTVMRITSVKPDSREMDKAEYPNSKKSEVHVRTQESHAP